MLCFGVISAEAAPPLSTPITIDTPTKNPTGRGAVFAFNARFIECLLLRFWAPRHNIIRSRELVIIAEASGLTLSNILN